MKKIFVYFTYEKYLNFVFKNNTNPFKDIKKFLPHKTNIFVLDVSEIIFFKDNRNYNKFFKKNKIKYIKIFNFAQLIKFLQSYKIISILKFPQDIFSLPILFLLKFFNVKSLLISNKVLVYDYNIQGSNKGKNLKQNLFNYLSFKTIRILSILNLIPKYNFYFDNNQSSLNRVEKSLSKRLEKVTKILKLSYYEKIYRINCEPYSQLLISKNKSENKYIVFCDGGFNHYDRESREGKVSNKIENLYFKNLYRFLIDLQKNLNKNVVYCLHPKVKKYNSLYFKKIKKDFQLKLNQTEKYLHKASLTVFFSTSSIATAILLNKKIINIKSKYLGKFYNLRADQEKKEINLKQFNIDNYSSKELTKFLRKIKVSKSSYSKYINLKMIHKTNDHWYNQVKFVLNKEFFDKKI